MRDVYLVGCGAAKLDHPAPAREFYTGSLFVAARRHVEALGVPWLILSAKYGVVAPEQELAPYEQTIPKRKEDLSAWVTRSTSSATSLSARWLDRERGIPDPTLDPRRFVFLCGIEYARPIALRLETMGYATQQPLAGMQLGERLHWFKTQRESAAA